MGLYKLIIWYRKKKRFFNKMKVKLDNMELGPVMRPSAAQLQPVHQDEEEEEERGGFREEAEEQGGVQEEREERRGVREERQAKQPLVKRRLETIIEIEEDSGYVQYDPATPPAASSLTL